MIKKLIRIVRKIFFALIMIYGYNILGNKINVNIPINIYTIFIITILDFPGMCSLLFIKIFLY